MLHPGTRLQGASTWIGSGAEVGTSGSATAIDTVMDEHASIGSGYVAAIALLAGCIEERIKQLGRFIEERGGTLPSIALGDPPPCPFTASGEHHDHVAWVKALTDDQVAAGVAWLEAIVDRVTQPALAQLGGER